MEKSDTWIVEERNEAIAAHRSKYWTGRKCARGHESQRYTKTGVCCKCNSENAMEYQKRKVNEYKGIDDPMTRVNIEIHRDQEQALRDYAEILNKMSVVEPVKAAASSITLSPYLGGGTL